MNIRAIRYGMISHHLALALLALALATDACRNGGAAAVANGAAKSKDTGPSSGELGPPAIDVFAPQVSGTFYPSDAAALRRMIGEMLDRAAGAGAKAAGKGRLLGFIVPHAGYRYSGPVAAHAFALLRENTFKRVIVLGPAHRRFYRVPALLDAGAYRTPLGDIPVDRKAVMALAKSGAAAVDGEKFKGEHALEVELPFLQAALGRFQLVPLMISAPDSGAARKLARAIFDLFSPADTLVVASSDMSHDFPYDVAVAMDENALRYVKALDTSGLLAAYGRFRKAGMSVRLQGDALEPECAQFCGMGPVMTIMEYAKLFRPAEVVVLDRRNSGDIVGDRNSRIVGYSAVAFFTKKELVMKRSNSGTSPAFVLSKEAKKELLEIARKTLVSYLEKDEKPDFSPRSPELAKPGAAFVTLKKHGRLRGCIGYMEPVLPLWQMVRDRAIDAAVHDSRFPPVKAEELEDIEIEISVLTPRQPVKDPLKDIVIGRDGVWLELGYNRGVFLPQVPVEQGWKTVEQYLDNLCRKAHVFRRGCWRSTQARLMRFQALVFSEKEPGD